MNPNKNINLEKYCHKLEEAGFLVDSGFGYATKQIGINSTCGIFPRLESILVSVTIDDQINLTYHNSGFEITDSFDIFVDSIAGYVNIFSRIVAIQSKRPALFAEIMRYFEIGKIEFNLKFLEQFLKRELPENHLIFTISERGMGQTGKCLITEDEAFFLFNSLEGCCSLKFLELSQKSLQ